MGTHPTAKFACNYLWPRPVPAAVTWTHSVAACGRCQAASDRRLGPRIGAGWRGAAVSRGGPRPGGLAEPTDPQVSPASPGRGDGTGGTQGLVSGQLGRWKVDGQRPRSKDEMIDWKTVAQRANGAGWTVRSSRNGVKRWNRYTFPSTWRLKSLTIIKHQPSFSRRPCLLSDPWPCRRLLAGCAHWRSAAPTTYDVMTCGRPPSPRSLAPCWRPTTRCVRWGSTRRSAGPPAANAATGETSGWGGGGGLSA